MFNIVKITKVVKNLTTYFNMIGSKEDIKATFLSPYGYYTNPKNKQGLLFENNKYIISLHSHKNIPIKLDTNDIIITDGKNYLHIDFNEDNINLKVLNNNNNTIGNDRNTKIANDDNNTIGNDRNVKIGNDDNNTIGNKMNYKANEININSNTNINIVASNTINLTAPNINFNTDNLTFNCKTFNVNASVGINFNSPAGSFKHNGINVGDTHTHFVKEMIFGGTNSNTPNP